MNKAIFIDKDGTLISAISVKDLLDMNLWYSIEWKSVPEKEVYRKIPPSTNIKISRELKIARLDSLTTL